ncbi:MAG TPA: hypothetical protein VFB74_33885 [Kribbellaceae bacterium]|nr:hypothetical protein [Kribbellaceae bacterium]
MTWRWPWVRAGREHGRAHEELERELWQAREDATIERAAAERRLREARRQVRGASERLDLLAAWITEALGGR